MPIADIRPLDQAQENPSHSEGKSGFLLRVCDRGDGDGALVDGEMTKARNPSIVHCEWCNVEIDTDVDLDPYIKIMRVKDRK